VTQGNALEEITTPSPDRERHLAAGGSDRERIFDPIAHSLVRMEPREAELAKLVCNAFLYMLFAATNQLHMLVDPTESTTPAFCARPSKATRVSVIFRGPASRQGHA
jgi:hypothetical protein